MSPDEWTFDRPFCSDCERVHDRTEHANCDRCSMDDYIFKALPTELYFDFKGWRFRAPFYCMHCARPICGHQWGFARACGVCDVGRGPRNSRNFWYAGPHELRDANARFFLEPERWGDPNAESVPWRHWKPAPPRKSFPPQAPRPRLIPPRRRSS